MNLDTYQTHKYTQSHWDLFNNFRSQALEVGSMLSSAGFEILIYGSIARGDINPKSDIDILVKDRIPSFRLEYVFEEDNLRYSRKYLVQSTPNDVIKVVYEFDPLVHIVLFLSKLPSSGYDFYHFGGALTFEDLSNPSTIRKPGVNKELFLIEPTKDGHVESQLVDRQLEAPKILGVSNRMIQQRIRVLHRRKKIGRTGVFLHQDLGQDENPETILHELAKTNRLIRKRLAN
ncbi:MAG: nucleotidyltransferase domain-containing protein [Promethearchaeota archaeon]